MSVLGSLPPRPLPESAVAALNRSESVDLVVSVGVTTGPAEDAASDETRSEEPGGPATELLVVTDSWAKGLALAPDDGWQVVETVSLSDTERFEALQQAEDAVLAFQAGGSEQAD
jgi:hypothetical protein